MSVILLVKLKSPLPLNEAGSASSVALRELLNLEHEPFVRAVFDESDLMGSASTGLLIWNSCRVVFSLSGHEEQARVTPFTAPVGVATNEGSYSFSDQSYLSITWHFKKTPLCWSLVAAVAVGLARKQGSAIGDNAGFFTNTELQGPDEFCRTLRLTTQQTDVERAAVALHGKMPKSAEITEWLKSQSDP
jgi:hypothetical protein